MKILVVFNFDNDILELVKVLPFSQGFWFLGNVLKHLTLKFNVMK